jgi:hypothetical protein
MESKVGRNGGNHKYSEAACGVGLRPSRSAAALIGLAALATVALMIAMPGALGPRILAATWVACAALEAIHARALHRGRRGVRAIVVRHEAEIAVQRASGEWRMGALRAGSFVAPWLTVIRWRPAGSRFDRTIPILPDMLAPEDFRRLRVMLRWS